MITVAIAVDGNNSLLGDPEFRMHGVPIEDEREDFLDEATAAVLKAIKDQKGDTEKLRESVRLAVRRVATSWTGKKPIVDVMIVATA
jgi:ribonuclease J